MYRYNYRCWVAAHMCVLSHFRTCDVRAEVHAESVWNCSCVVGACWHIFDLRCAIALFAPKPPFATLLSIRFGTLLSLATLSNLTTLKIAPFWHLIKILLLKINNFQKQMILFSILLKNKLKTFICERFKRTS